MSLTPQQLKMNAERLMGDETLKSALDMVKEDAIGVFTHGNATQDQIMEAHRMVLALDAFENKLRALIVDGQFAERKK